MSIYVRGTGKTGRRNSTDARFKADGGRFSVALPQWASEAILEMATRKRVTKCRLVCEWVIQEKGKESRTSNGPNGGGK
jgi:hypothetical protein